MQVWWGKSFVLDSASATFQVARGGGDVCFCRRSSGGSMLAVPRRTSSGSGRSRARKRSEAAGRRRSFLFPSPPALAHHVGDIGDIGITVTHLSVHCIPPLYKCKRSRRIAVQPFAWQERMMSFTLCCWS